MIVVTGQYNAELLSFWWVQSVIKLFFDSYFVRIYSVREEWRKEIDFHQFLTWPSSSSHLRETLTYWLTCCQLWQWVSDLKISSPPLETNVSQVKTRVPWHLPCHDDIIYKKHKIKQQKHLTYVNLTSWKNKSHILR